MTTLFGYFALALALSLLLTPLCRVAAFRLGCVARPRRDRWHDRPTALLGGVAIGAAVVLGWLAAGSAAETRLLLLCGVAILTLGLIDDLVSLRPSTKLVIQIAIAAVFVFFEYRLRWVESQTIDALLTMIWIVGVVNAFNLLDNMDGLSAGIAIIAATALLAASASGGGIAPSAVYTALLLGAVSGFLVFNFPPASIFMGDSGSLFIGLTLAALTLASNARASTDANVLSVVAAPVMVLLIPIFDTALVTVSRLVSGRSPARGGRDHTSHRLVAIGLSERSAVLVLWTLAVLGGGIAVLTRRIGNDWSTLLTVVFLLAMAVFAAYLTNVRVYEDADGSMLRSGRITRFVADFMYKRRVAEVLLDFGLVAASYYGAYRLRFEGREFNPNFGRFMQSLPLVVAVQMVSLFAAGVYRGVWRYFSLMDAVAIGKGVASGTAAVICLVVFLDRFRGYSRSVFIIYAALLILMITASRASFRLISEFARRRRQGARVVIYGAGDEGHFALHGLLHRPDSGYRMVGFIDDDEAMRRVRVGGYPVLGGRDVLAGLITTREVDCLVISTALVRDERLKAIEHLCEEHGVSILVSFGVRHLASLDQARSAASGRAG
jgi:UDP-GlcNAc:undecaprenyl-phosphate GlcNAc-1-phosphate transferase